MSVGSRIDALLLAVCFAVFGLTASAWPQEDAEDSPYRPGLIANYTASGQTIARTDEVVAFDWQNASPDSRLPEGDFTAVWRGRLWARGAGSYRLACYAQGEVELKLAGKTIISGRAAGPQWLESQPIDLEFDYHPLEITFRRSQPSGQLAVFWSGPDFRLEPIPARFLLHDRDRAPSSTFERGGQLASALRCAACHQDSAATFSPAPALDRLSGNIHETWLIDWLSSHGGNDANKSLRRMPDLAMTKPEAEAIAAWLLRDPPQKSEQRKTERKETKVTKDDSSKKKSGKKAKGEEQPKPSAEAGERLILTRGCLACHQFGEFGASGLFGGGDLTALATKRPSDFLIRWLENPSTINRHHRMPQFTFTPDELTSLSLWAQASSKSPSRDQAGSRSAGNNSAKLQQGKQLLTSLGCASCHAVLSDKDDLLAPSQKQLIASSDWSRSCADQPRREKTQPGYRLSADDQLALKAYYAQPRPGENRLSPQARGRDLLTQLNCLACHQREGASLPLPLGEGRGEGGRLSGLGLSEKLTSLAESHADLAPLVPAMTPPALNSVGDKLHDTALADAISRQGPPHRPYLLVQMPKFNLTKDQLDSLVAYFTSTDRIPSGIGVPPVIANGAGETPTLRLLAAGPRLVTTDGLACTSCHQVGSILPSKAPLNARGPDMSMLGKRIRREWFDRWCDNPARIVPRMEMPAVKIPVRGVLSEKIDDQLAAVWHILNTPGFEPPEPNPVRVLRLSGVPEKNERPIVIHDVFKDGDKTYLYPIVIGLPNRHNILFDLETNRLAAWWLGDTARQRTKGKSWYWEMGGKSILDLSSDESEISFVKNNNEVSPIPDGQFRSPLQVISTIGDNLDNDIPWAIRWITQLKMPSQDSSRGGNIDSVQVFNSFAVRQGGWTRQINLFGPGDVREVRFRVISKEIAAKSRWDTRSKTLSLPGAAGVTIRPLSPAATWNGDGTFSFRDEGQTGKSSAFKRNQSKASSKSWSTVFQFDYSTMLPADQFATNVPSPATLSSDDVQIAPGFVGRRLPLPSDLMPSALTWHGPADLIFTTLKGELFRANDSNSDDTEDRLELLVDGLATPYGVHASTYAVHVAAKNGILGVPLTPSGPAELISVLASGWGHTDDYHDWTVGLIEGDNQEYYVALPCQQDQRSTAAANLRGKLLKLVPRKPTSDNPHIFNVEVISAGHRFPMGIARNREGELFVTDNQGNYNPFNELNHVKKGAHFGFINALEKQSGFVPPPLTPPAINIPHPWTRSVNGICFLDTPLAGTKPGPGAPGASLLPANSLYGPFEGHLVGCEYDTRRLIRMSLQKIGDTYQGCAYPLSIPPDDVEKGLLGPIVCAVKPTTGELYVGEIRDSGWGASNNIGQIVKIKIEPAKLPCGIAEVRATSTGFAIDFIQPVDPAKAADAASYSIQSYRRESTPAYGGPDLDRRDETISSVTLSPDSKRATLTLPNLRPGHVYELQLKNLAPAGAMFHPDQAHYTLNQIPND